MSDRDNDSEAGTEPDLPQSDNVSYHLEEWIQLEAASYADYLRNMSGIELVEEYYRQGGEDVIFFDQRSNRLVVNDDNGAGCP